jgi:hypothetical protein
MEGVKLLIGGRDTDHIHMVEQNDWFMVFIAWGGRFLNHHVVVGITTIGEVMLLSKTAKKIGYFVFIMRRTGDGADDVE